MCTDEDWAGKANHKAPSINCWTAKNIGIAANGSSLRLARRTVTAPIVNSAKLAVKLAVAEKQIVFTPDSRK